MRSLGVLTHKYVRLPRAREGHQRASHLGAAVHT